MRIIQITDIHIGAEGDPTRDIDVRKNFGRIWNHALSSEPDIIVISGDLCYKAPEQEIYDWVDEQIEDAPCSVYMIVGNHDDSTMMSTKYLPAKPDELRQKYYTKKEEIIDIIFLDTGIGRMSETQWTWFEKELDEAERPLIFMHHPPILCGAAYMDGNHAFKEIDRFNSLMDQSRHPHTDIFCGHYHVHKTVSTPKYSVHLTPSCIFQLDQDKSEFGIDHFNIGYRIIDISKETICHRVVYC